MRLAIGDLHGRDYRERVLNEDFEECYFTGDYFDSFDIPFERQYRNFGRLCAAVRGDGRLKLCLGNHDYHYMRGVLGQRYSGFQKKNHAAIAEILEQNIDLLNVLYLTHDHYIISHAGLSRTFMNKMKKAGVKTIEEINGAFLNDRNILNFDGFDMYGDDPTQSPIWIRPRSLCGDAVPGYSQIVGHTEIAAIREMELKGASGFPGGKHGGKLVFIDTGNLGAVYRF
jgi:hypothetical protein